MSSSARACFLSALLCFALAAAACSTPSADAPGSGSEPGEDGDRARESAEPPATLWLTADVVSLPIQMVGEFPLVAARINGVAGKLMFDTGGQEALSLDDRVVPLHDGRVVGRGFVESGQAFEVRSYPTVESVELEGPLVYRNVRDVDGQDLSFVAEAVGPDFLGFLGYRFFAGYLFELDYRSARLTFYRDTEARRASQDYLDGERIVAVLPFETRKLPNHPIVRLTVGGVPFVGAFDTGQDGGACVSVATQQHLEERNLLTSAATSEGDEPRFDLRGLEFTSSFTGSVSGITVGNERSPAATPLGIAEADLISLGYAFLSQYKSVWDFGERKIYLLEP